MAQANRDEAIRHLQSYLRQIAFFDPNMTLVSIDGIYNPETQAAVRVFQRQNGLPVTGKVDKTTWDAIYEAYKQSLRAHAKPLPIDMFAFSQSGYVMKPGTKGFWVEAVQFMLDEISIFYQDIIPPERTGLYDEQTSVAVTAFQRNVGLEATGEVDLETWNALSRVYNNEFRRNNQ